MSVLLNLLPLAALWVGYKLGGIYVATAALMVAMVLVALVDYLRTRHVSAMHALSTVLVLVFGGATLALHDPRFLKVKPTILLWLMALAFLASQWLGRAPLIQRMLEPALPPGTSLTRARWLRVNLVWVVAYLLLGALNLYVVHTAGDQAWIDFKIFLYVAIVALAMGQALWLHRAST